MLDRNSQKLTHCLVKFQQPNARILDTASRQVHNVLTSQQKLLFTMIRSVVKSFKVPVVEVVAARLSNESALSTDSTPKKLGRLDAGPGWMS